MKNSADDNAVSLRLIEDDVFTLLETADTRVNPITSPTQTGRVSKPVKTPGQLIKVVFGLFFAPGIYCVIEYLCQIRNTFRSKPVGAQAMLPDHWTSEPPGLRCAGHPSTARGSLCERGLLEAA